MELADCKRMKKTQRVVQIGITLSLEDISFMKENGLSPTLVCRKSIEELRGKA
jgi:hypothetical protein